MEVNRLKSEFQKTRNGLVPGGIFCLPSFLTESRINGSHDRRGEYFYLGGTVMDEERYTAELDRLSHLLQEEVDDNIIQYSELVAA